MPSCVASISIILHFVVLYIWYVITLKAKDLDQLYWLVHCISNYSYKHILSYLIPIHFYPIKRNRSNQLFQAKIHVYICICAINKINTMHRHHEISQELFHTFLCTENDKDILDTCPDPGLSILRRVSLNKAMSFLIIWSRVSEATLTYKTNIICYSTDSITIIKNHT